MIVNFHPKEIESKKGLEVITSLVANNSTEKVFHVTEKTYGEWKEIVKSDEKIIIVAPIYWWNLGYEFDKWLQNVFTYNFAYTFDNGQREGLLNGRPFELHLTHATPDEYAQFMKDNMVARLKTGIFEYCGATVEVSFHHSK